LENLANKNHETPDCRPEGTKLNESSIFVTTFPIIKAPNWFF